MRKQKNKLAIALLMLVCASGCVGAGVATMTPTPSNSVVAQAETTYTTHDIGALVLHVNSTVGGAKGDNKVLYLQREDGGALPVLTWDLAFATTDGFKINGEVASVEMKSTADGMYFAFSAVNAGDIITISGEYVCEANATKYIIAKSQFIWTGSAWNRYIEVEYTTYEIGALNFLTMEPNRLNMAYFNRMDGEAIPIKSTENDVNWTTAFNFLANSGVGITLNGQSINPTLKFPDQVFIELSANPSAGDILVIGGTFYSQDLAVKYVITESSFKFNGTNWEAYTKDEEGTDTPEITYREYTVSELIVHIHSTAGNVNSNNTTLWLYGTGDISDAWAYYVCESGAGIKINGESATVEVQDFSGGLYIKEFSVAAGDIISIGGTFVNDERATKYIIAEHYFQWNGSGWVAYVPPVVYEEYTLSNLKVADTSMAGGAYCANNVLSVSMEGGAQVSDWPWFIHESGAGLKVNGESAALTGGIPNAIQDTTGGLYFTFAAVEAGDVVSIGGTFTNADLALKYVIPESKFIWTGSGWVAEETDEEKEYTEYNVGVLTVNPNSVPGADTAVNTSLYLIKQNGSTEDDWTRYTYVSGAGFKVNGETATLNAIQNVGDGLYLAFEGVSEGDVISIEGTYVCEDTLIKYFIDEAKFLWNGSGWEKCVEYTEYNVSELIVHLHSTAGNENTNNTTLWLFGTGATNDSWAIYTQEDGEGVKLNGEALEATVKEFNGGLHLEFASVSEGDVIFISGTYVCDTTAIRYVIDEAKFVWNGSGWEKYVEYTVHELGVIEPNPNSATVGVGSARPDHLYTVELGTLPVQDWDAPFVLDSGYGVKINGEEVASFEVKSTDGGLWFGLSGVQANDVISICGTFKNEKHAVKYVIEESKMVWSGSAWEKYVEYTTHNVGGLKLSATPSGATFVYLSRVNGEKMPIDSWDHAFRFRQGSGTGLTLNGEALNTNDIKSPGGDLYIGLGVTAKEGDVLVMGGTFYSVDLAVEYIIADSTFIFENSAWISTFDKAKIEAKEELTAYKNAFSQEDYYEAEWAFFDTIIAEGEVSIDAAATDEEVRAAVAAAKAKMDEVVTKAESDAIFNDLKTSTKNDLAAYKSENDYRAAEWTEIQAIIQKANTEIDASESVTAINTAVANAKAEIDAVKTNAQWEADEAAVAAAKAELAAYKAESDYKSAEWTEIQAIITKANGDIDNAIGDEEVISGIVAAAKAEMDKVKTAAQVDAEVAVVVAAKAELAAYKSESNYKSAEWTAIQTIITQANGDIDNAIGDEEAINGIVAAAKAEMDKVKTAKVVAEDEVRAYYNAIDHDLYSEEAEEIISGYIAEVMAAIDSATTNEELDAAIAQFKANVESVETLKPTEDSSSTGEDKKSSGCGSSLTVGGVSASVALAAAVAMLLKKKED